MKRFFAWTVAMVAVFGIPVLFSVLVFYSETPTQTGVTALLAGWFWREAIEDIGGMQDFVEDF